MSLSGSMYEVGQVVNAVSARLESKVTTPPERFTEATLLDEMGAAYKYAKTDSDREVLKKINGLGTARTKVEIISGLIRRQLFHITKKGKRHEVTPDEMAIKMDSLLPQVLLDPATTAKWEMAFLMIERGEVGWEQVVARQYELVRKVIEQAKLQMSGAPASHPR